MTANRQTRSAVLCGLVGAWGVLNGFAVFILWTSHEPGQTAWSFALGLIAAAIASWVIESLRDRLRPAERPGEKPAPERTRIARLVLTLVSLATFELFIVAIDRSITVFSHAGERGELRERLLGPALLGVGGVTRDLLALAGMWVLAGAAVSAALAHVVTLPRRQTLAQRSRAGLLSGILAGALAAPVLVLLYVLGIRIVLALQLALFDPAAWQQHVDTLAPPDLLRNYQGEIPWPLAAWYSAFQIIGPLFTSGGLGKLEAFAIVAVLVAIGVRFKKWWPFAIFAIAISIAVTAPLARDLGDLFRLPLLAAVVWVVPGAILGAATPLLENPAQRARLWAAVSVTLGAIVMAVTLIAHQNVSFLVAGVALAGAGAVLLRRDDLQIAWPFLAIAVSLGTSSTTAVVLHVSAGFHSVLTHVANINALPANNGEDPNHLIRDLRDAGLPKIANSLYGLRQRRPDQRTSLLGAASTAVRGERDVQLGYTLENERLWIDSEPAQLATCRAYHPFVLGGTPPPNICVGMPVPRLRSMTLVGFAQPPATVSDAQLRERIVRDQQMIERARTGPNVPMSELGKYNVWTALSSYEARAAATAATYATIDAEISAEQRVAAADEAQAHVVEAQVRTYTASGYPEELELAMAGSVAFWMTVGLLAAWQSRRNAEGAADLETVSEADDE